MTYSSRVPFGARRSTPKLLVYLALASGWCGIAYELLYSRVLTTFLGDMFHVNVAILTSFLLGIGIGSAIARRFWRFLWLVELLIGIYGFGVAAGLSYFENELLQIFVPRISGGPWITILIAFALTSFPACLIGFSVPLFSLYNRLACQIGRAGSSFRKVYGLYNFGAGLCVLCMEYGLLRWWGIRATIYCLAGVNLTSGFLLLWLGRPESPKQAHAPVVETSLRLDSLALFFCSVLSGLYQLFLLKLTEILFGPFHENFALVLALGLSGIAAASYLVEKRQVRFDSVLLRGSILVAAVFICFAPLIYTWATLNGAFGLTPWLSRAIKIGMLSALGGGPILIFGATIPALIQDSSTSDPLQGRLLCISSLGNCAGYLLAVFLVYERTSYALLALLFPAGLWLISVSHRLLRRQRLESLSLATPALLLLVPFAWPSSLLQLSYREYIKLDVLNRALARVAGFEEVRKFDENVKLIRTSGGETEVIINGYRSLISSRSGKTNLKELIVGAAPALYPAKRERALVLGVGTGITAGATASLFQRTTGVEINPAVIAALPRFSEHNLRLLEQPNFRLVLDDGLSYLARSREQYDAIVSTVTSPLYFSSSKLYTREFFKLARSRLAPGGVYAMWFDSRVTPDGAKIIFETIRESFVDCHLLYLTPVYSELICGAQKLAPHPLSEAEWGVRLAEKIGAQRFHLSTNQFIEALVLPTHQVMTTRWDAPVNTLDRPQLEFLMASVSLSDVDLKKAWTPYRLATADLAVSVEGPQRLTADEVAMRCFIFRVVGEVDYPDCPSPFARSGPQVPLAYLDALEQLLDADESPTAILLVAEQIAARGNLERGLSILDRVESKMKNRADYRELRARLRFDSGRELPDQELTEIYRLTPLGTNLRRLLARVCARRGQAQDALAHLAILRQLGGMRASDQELVDALVRRFPVDGATKP